MQEKGNHKLLRYIHERTWTHKRERERTSELEILRRGKDKVLWDHIILKQQLPQNTLLPRVQVKWEKIK